MNNKEILEQAIQKAIDGGWKGWWYYDGPRERQFTTNYLVFPSNYFGDITIQFMAQGVRPMPVASTSIIFNHDFAKTLWGEDTVIEHYSVNCSVARPRFAHHLQQMVIAEDPIKYLGYNL